MKIIIEHQKWDWRMTIDTYIYLSDELDIIGSYDIQKTPDDERIKLIGLYVQIPYRCKGYADIFMKDVLKNYPSADIIILVRKLKHVINWYSSYGFKHYCKDDKNFKWMILKRKNNK